MIRKLAIALSLLGMCFAGFVHALGLGEATVKSALNQPLNAEIELVNTAGLSINEILPGLATREEFQKANVDRVYFLSDLRFEVKTNSQGKAFIVLTSKKPVREPFLNFLVELIWPSGRLLREYALLIDPPLFTETTPVKAAPAASTYSTSGDVLKITNNAGVQKRSILESGEKVSSGTYGPTTATDTLWEIALKARPNRSVSPQQVMLAIQNLNPDAFIDNNINKMKAGQVLRLPSLDEIKQLDQYQAIQLVISQNEAHLGKRSPSIVQGSKAQAEVQRKKPAPSATAADELKLVVADEGQSGTSNSANSGQSGQSGNDTSLAVTLEKLDKASIENKELTSKVGDLEEQLATLQRLLTLKNDQLAAIQTQMRESEQAKLQALAEQTTVQSATTGGQAQEAVSVEQAMVETAPAEVESAAEVDGATADATETAVTGDPVQQSDTGQPETPVDPAIAPVTAQTGSVIQDEPVISSKNKVANENFIEKIVNNPVYLAISLLIVLVLVFILWLVSRHNAQKEQEFQSINALYEGSSDDEYASDSNENLTEGLTAFDELDDEQDSKDVDADYSEGHDDSQDVIAEANAYISYGRLDQAANILEKAISNDPVRTDYRLKLLSVYKDIGDRQAFERQYSELEAIQDDAALLNADKIREEMLDEELVALETKEAELSLDREEASLEAEQKHQETKIESEEEAIENDLKSFDFDSVSLDEAEEEIDLTSELDLDSLDVGDLEAEALETDLLEDQIDIEEDLHDLEDVAADVESEDFDDSILDVDLEDLDLNAELEQETEIDLSGSSSAAPEKAEELVVSDDILEEAIQEFEGESDVSLEDNLDDDDDFDFLNGADEASTKLDLARAYIDMGDIEGAKDILQEVTKEGSEAQQAEAKDLLASLD